MHRVIFFDSEVNATASDAVTAPPHLIRLDDRPYGFPGLMNEVFQFEASSEASGALVDLAGAQSNLGSVHAGEDLEGICDLVRSLLSRLLADLLCQAPFLAL